MNNIFHILKDLQENSLLRSLRPISSVDNSYITIEGKRYVDFASNDYLGLANHPELKSAAMDAISKYGSGSRASRLLSGDLDLHHKLEEKIALFKGTEKALFFNSGYQANIGVLGTLPSRGDIIFADKLIHASLLDGIRLSGAILYRYHHNDMEHLESLIEKRKRGEAKCFVVTESIFSMGGDRAPLKDLVKLKKKYDLCLIVDEAHATGLFGQNGSGLVEAENVIDGIDIQTGTFGKALGSFGAYVASSEEVIKFLINKARSFIYTTALPAGVVAANIASLDLVTKEPARRKELFEKVAYFTHQLREAGWSVKSDTHIIPLIIGNNSNTVKLSDTLKKEGCWVPAIRPPTVPNNTSRLRFSLSYHHSYEVLEKISNIIKKCAYV